MENVFVGGFARTPIGKLDGNLKTLTAEALAVEAIRAVLSETGLSSDEIGEVIIGNAKQTSTHSNLGRYVTLAADLPVKTPAYTVQRQDASGMQAIINGYAKVKSGNASIILAGGTESMSQIPYEILNARYEFAPDKIVMHPIEAMITGGLPREKYGIVTLEAINKAMGEKYAITEEEQKEFVQLSQRKAAESPLKESITSIQVKLKKMTLDITRDDIYDRIEMKALPADAAAVCLLMSKSALDDNNLKPIAEIVSIGTSAGDPLGEGLLGTAAAKKALNKAGKSIENVDFIEVNEITAAQVLATAQSLGISKSDVETKVNVHGGALATGNPWGAAGAILLERLISSLKKADKEWGLALCGAAGGQAIAVVVRIV
ncbi:thiolase family protein [Clostridium transplantifaecale]|uniref:thiolase family protein n=1 Tax=Clostridium transplantifaecale TaxID=2479838 RepID=UPI000F63C7DE|nr:thiolase family protein [Clostridium transplantifaecale]